MAFISDFLYGSEHNDVLLEKSVGDSIYIGSVLRIERVHLANKQTPKLKRILIIGIHEENEEPNEVTISYVLINSENIYKSHFLSTPQIRINKIDCPDIITKDSSYIDCTDIVEVSYKELFDTIKANFGGVVLGGMPKKHVESSISILSKSKMVSPELKIKYNLTHL